MDPNIPGPAADKRSVGEADGGGVSNTGDTDAAEMTDVDTVSTVASSSTTKKRACGRKDDDDDAKMEDPATRPVKRQRRVHFDPVVSVGLAPTGVDRTSIQDHTPLTHTEYRALVCAQLKARMLQTAAAAAQRPPATA